MLSAASWVTLSASPALASSGVQGETVVHGNVTFHREGGNLYIHASDGSIINYSQFSISHGSMVQFLQPHEMARVLNRVVGNTPSMIEGTLLSNGHVYLVNPAGIVFGAGSVLNVGGIHAAAGSMTNSNFLNGVNKFRDLSGEVINFGSINGKEVHLIGNNVANHGNINAGSGGIITMLAGDEVHIRRIGDRIAVRIDGVEMLDRPMPMHGSTGADMLATPGVENTGSLHATGGQFALGAGDMYALAVRNTGSITNAGGHVDVIAQDGLIQNDGLISVGNSGGAGGKIVMQGPSILNRGEVNADGNAGEIEMTSQHHTFMTPGSVVSAKGGSGVATGGDVLIHSYEGITILANGALVDIRGGNAGGDGGYVEISGETVMVNGDVRVEAQPGWQGGTLLIDPLDIIINELGGDDAFLGDGFFEFNENGMNDSFIAANTLENIFGTIHLQAQGSIFVETEVNLTLHNDLIFEAFGDIIFLHAINGARTMLLHADWDNDGIGFVSINVPLTVTDWVNFRGNQIRLNGSGGGTPGFITTGIYQLYNGQVLIGGDMTLNSGEVIFANTVNSFPFATARSLTINANTTTFGGSVGNIDRLQSLLINGNTLLNGSSVGTIADQTYNGQLYLGANNVLSSSAGGTIRFGGTVDGSRDLSVATDGMIRFDGRVGGNERLTMLALSGNGTTHVYDDIDADIIDIDNQLVLNTDLTLTAPVSLGLRHALGNGFRLDLNSPDTLLRGTIAGLDRLRTDGVGLTTLQNAIIQARLVHFREAVQLAGNAQIDGTDEVRFDGTVDGAHDLDVRSDAVVRFGGNVGATTALGSLNVQSGMSNQLSENNIIFAGSLVRAEGDITLNGDGKDAPAHVATIAGLGDLTIESLSGDVLIGANEKVTALGDLTLMAANGIATFGDLNALGDLTVDADSIQVRRRAGGQVLTSSGALVSDSGVDFVAGGGIFFSSAPTLIGNGSAPTFNSGTGTFSSSLDAFARETRSLGASSLTDADNRVLDLRAIITPPPPPPVDPERTPGSLASTFGELLPIVDRVDREVMAVAALERFSLFLRSLSDDELRTIPEGRAIFTDQVDTGHDSDQPVLTNAARLRRDAVMRLMDRYSRVFVVTAVDPETGEEIVVNENQSDEIRAALDAALAAYRAANVDGDIRTFASTGEAHRDAAVYLDGLRDLLAELEAVGATPTELRASVRAVLSPVVPAGMSLAEFEQMIRG